MGSFSSQQTNSTRSNESERGATVPQNLVEKRTITSDPDEDDDDDLLGIFDENAFDEGNQPILDDEYRLLVDESAAVVGPTQPTPTHDDNPSNNNVRADSRQSPTSLPQQRKAVMPVRGASQRLQRAAPPPIYRSDREEEPSSVYKEPPVWLDRSRKIEPLRFYPTPSETQDFLHQLFTRFFHLFRSDGSPGSSVVPTTAITFDFADGRFTCRMAWMNRRGVPFSEGVPLSYRYLDLHPDEGHVLGDRKSGGARANFEDWKFPTLTEYIKVRMTAPLLNPTTYGPSSRAGLVVKNMDGTYAFGFRVWVAGSMMPIDPGQATFKWGAQDGVVVELVKLLYVEQPWLGAGREYFTEGVNGGDQSRKRPRPTGT
ncbi:MAG: hypothetical protein M1831_004275 [Alyxoria varia]|nr:MAG: hypothetical protein M1831_004275 [Alyxoria varia]